MPDSHTFRAASLTVGRTYGLAAMVVLVKPFSNLLFASGVKAFPASLAGNPMAYLQVLGEPLVILAVALQIFWLLARMALLSRADLSFVVPATSVGYALSVMLANLFLREPVSFLHWAGVLMITAGSTVVASTRPVTRFLNSRNSAAPANGAQR